MFLGVTNEPLFVHSTSVEVERVHSNSASSTVVLERQVGLNTKLWLCSGLNVPVGGVTLDCRFDRSVVAADTVSRTQVFRTGHCSLLRQVGKRFFQFELAAGQVSRSWLAPSVRS